MTNGEGGAARRLFRFVQAEFPFLLGPADGRYVLRGHAGEPEHVLVLETLGALQRRLLKGKRPTPAEPEPGPEPVPTTRVTLVDTAPLEGVGKAEDWLKRAELDEEVDRAFDVLNRVLQAHRISAADAFAREVAADQALVVRVGVGEGEQVAMGRWTAARELPRPTVGRQDVRNSGALRPHERLAAILGGRDVTLACEELVLRARLDVDRDRPREAALQLRVALEAAIAELEAWTEVRGMDQRLDELRECRSAVGTAANEALRGGLAAETAAEVDRVVGRIEAALRARTAAGIPGA